MPEERLSGRAKIIDGDSFELGAARVRLYGIDAPEARQPCTRDGREWACGAAAARELRRLTGSATITCVRRDVDDYGRIVARCEKGSVDIAAAMVRAGFATAYRRYSTAYVDEEREARAAKRGIWAGETQMIDDLRVAARLIKAKHPDLPLFLLGESMGGAVVMTAAVGDDPPVADGLILAAPAVWGWQTLSPLALKITEGAAHFIPWVTVVPTGVHARASSNRAALYDLARDPLVIKETRIDTAYGLVNLMTHAFDAAAKLEKPRWLLLFGEREGILDRGAVNKALPHFRDLPPEQGRIAIYPRGYHLLLRDFEQYTVYDDMAAWIRDPAAPLPSGADQRGAAKSIN